MSKRFAAAACSPELLREAHLLYIQGLGNLHAAAAWLAQHGRHVRKLSFSARLAAGEDKSSATSALAACLAAAGAAGQLAELQMTCSAPTDWLATMRSLRRLSLAGDKLVVSPAIAQLTALQSLELKSQSGLGSMTLQAGVSLPANLTRLCIANHAQEMPPRVGLCMVHWSCACLSGQRRLAQGLHSWRQAASVAHC